MTFVNNRREEEVEARSITGGEELGRARAELQVELCFTEALAKIIAIVA